MFERTIKIENITPMELAQVFCRMFADQQAEFFGHIDAIARPWPGAGWCGQSCAIVANLDAAGIETITTLASHLPLEYRDRIAAA